MLANLKKFWKFLNKPIFEEWEPFEESLYQDLQELLEIGFSQLSA